MFYPDEIIEEVRMRNDIAEVVSGYVKLQKKGGNYFGLCPFHSEKSPSFSVSPAKQMYYCFGCGAGGNVITFVMEYENYTFPEALKYLAERVGVALPEQEYSKEAKEQADRRTALLKINKLAASYFYYQLRQPGGQLGFRYLTGRQLSEETIRHFGLGFANKTSDDLYRYLRSKGYDDAILKESGLVTFEERGTYDKFWNRVIFPIMDVNNRVLGFGGRVMGEGTPKYLNSPETKLFDKSRNLYGLNYARVSREKYMIICEGYMDVIALHQAGFTNAVASLGTAFTAPQAGLLKRYTGQAVLTYDSDSAGEKAALRAIPMLREVGIAAKVLNMKPYKDPDELIKTCGAEEFRNRIAQAKNSFLFEIQVLRSEFDLEDPEQKTRFHNAVARKLLAFREALERDNYIQAVAEEYFINYEDLKRLVNQLGDAAALGTSWQDVKTKSWEDMKGPGTSWQDVKTKSWQDTKTDPGQDRDMRPGYDGKVKRGPAAKKKEDGIRRSSRLLLTWLIEDPELFEAIRGRITAADFIDPLYQQAAAMVFAAHEKGNLNPAGILNHFINDEEQYKEVAALFNTGLKESLSREEQRKAFMETVIKVKKHSLEEASRHATDIGQLQAIIKEQAALKEWRMTM